MTLYRVNPAEKGGAVHNLTELKVVRDENSLLPSQRGLKLRVVLTPRSGLGIAPSLGDGRTLPAILLPRGFVELTFAFAAGGQALRKIRGHISSDRWTLQADQGNSESIPLGLEDVEELSRIRSGQDLFVRWKVQLQGALGLDAGLMPIELYDSSQKGNDALQVSPQSFNQDFTVPAGLSARLLVEYPIPVIDQALKVRLPAELHTLFDLLSQSASDLQTALEAWRAAKYSSDFGGVMGSVRGLMEKVRDEVSNVQTKLADTIYIQTAVLSGSGASEAAEEMVSSTLTQIQGLFDLASKAPHGTTKKNRLQYSIRPDTHDAEATLRAALTYVSYLVARLERYSTQRS